MVMWCSLMCCNYNYCRIVMYCNYFSLMCCKYDYCSNVMYCNYCSIVKLWCTVITLVWCTVITILQYAMYCNYCSVRCCNYCSAAVTVLYPWPGGDIWDKSVTYRHGVMLLLNHHIHGKIFYRILPKIEHKCQQPSSFMTPISEKLKGEFGNLSCINYIFFWQYLSF